MHYLVTCLACTVLVLISICFSQVTVCICFHFLAVVPAAAADDDDGVKPTDNDDFLACS